MAKLNWHKNEWPCRENKTEAEADEAVLDIIRRKIDALKSTIIEE